MKMAWQENNPPMFNLQLPNWISPGQGQNFGIPSASGSSSRYSSHHCRQVQNFTRTVFFSIDLEEPTPIHELTIYKIINELNRL